MIDRYELASEVFGTSRAEKSATSLASTIITGTAVEDSEDGTVSVIPDGLVTASDGDDNAITLPTSPSVKSGDNVIIISTGGTATTPIVTAASGSGDRMEEEITEVSTRIDATYSVAAQNLSPFFDHPLDDVYNASTNPDGYWRTNNVSTYYTPLGDGWAHFSESNSSGSAVQYRWFPVAQDWVALSKKYTLLIELKNVTASGTVRVYAGSGASAYGIPQMFYESKYATVSSGTTEIRLTYESKSDFTDCTALLATSIYLFNGASLTCDIRASLYEGDYQGGYKSYKPTEVEVSSLVKQTADSIMSTVEITYDSRNLCAEEDWEDGYLQSGNTTVLGPAGNNKNKASGLIPVTPGRFVTFQTWIDDTTGYNSYAPLIYYRFYKNASTVIGSRTSATGETGTTHLAIEAVEVPSNAAFVRFSWRGYNGSRSKLEYGTNATEYSTAQEDLVSMSTTVTQTAQDVTTALNLAAAQATMVRQYGDGVLVCKTGNTVGALVNADGSFDVVAVTWSGDTPTAGTVLASFGTSTQIGASGEPNVGITSSGITVRHYGTGPTASSILSSVFGNGGLTIADVLAMQVTSNGASTFTGTMKTLLNAYLTLETSVASIAIGADNQGPMGNADLGVGADGIYYEKSARFSETPGADLAITRYYTSNGFTVENAVFHATAEIVVMPIQFSATSNAEFAATKVATIPSDYAPTEAVRFVVWCAPDWSSSNFKCGYGQVDTSGNVTLTCPSAKYWMGQAVWIRG